jgi:hypothetical protein
MLCASVIHGLQHDPKRKSRQKHVDSTKVLIGRWRTPSEIATKQIERFPYNYSSDSLSPFPNCTAFAGKLNLQDRLEGDFHHSPSYTLATKRLPAGVDSRKSNNKKTCRWWACRAL